MDSPVTDNVRIYLAARFNGHRADPNASNPNTACAGQEPYPYHLESYHYVKHGRHDWLIRELGYKIFMDSGAFSMFTQGAEVDLEAYGQFCEERADYIEVASNVDAIGAGKELLSYQNQKTMERMKLSVPVCPVHHARDDDSWLVKYLDEGYDYIFLGGMVPESTPYLIDWLDHIWGKYLALPDGSARVKIHGFGLTTLELMDRYPWFSVDSTSWVQLGMFGGISVVVDGKVRNLSISSQSGSVKQFDRSYWSLDAVSRAAIDAQFEREGFKAEELSTMWGMRDRWNMRFYRRHMEGLKPRFVRKQVTFFT